VCACLFREFQLSASYEGLIETVPGVNLALLRMDNYEIDKTKDTLFRGEFEVVRELLAAFDDGAASKSECDKVIDKNGPKPKGSGIKQLRENIAESKLSYEIMDDAAQAFLKTKIMDNIQKYFYLICFTGYLREQSIIAKDGVTEEQKKAFSLTGGKGIYLHYLALRPFKHDQQHPRNPKQKHKFLIWNSVICLTPKHKFLHKFLIWMIFERERRETYLSL
jgi:hypothetical protein